MSKKISRGIITISIGDSFYNSLAADLARSLEVHCPDIPRAIITNRTDSPELSRLYQHLIQPVDEESYAFSHKLLLNDYSPFEETLYIDADSLVFRDLGFIWEQYKDQSVGFQGRVSREGEWYKQDMAQLIAKLDLSCMVQIQTGLLYFDKSDKSEEFFAIARDTYPKLPELGFRIWEHRAKDAMSDEPAFGISASKLGLMPAKDPSRLMGFPMGITSKLEIDVIAGNCQLTSGPGYYLESETKMKPSVFHFCTWHTHPVYTGERSKLRLSERFPWSTPVVGPVASLVRFKEKFSQFLKR